VAAHKRRTDLLDLIQRRPEIERNNGILCRPDSFVEQTK